MKQTWETAKDLRIGDTVEITGTKKKRMILNVKHLDGIVEITIKEYTFALNSNVLVAVFS